DFRQAAAAGRHMAGALHHRQGREVAGAALLAVGRPGRRHVCIRRLAAAPEARGRSGEIHGREKEAGQEGGEEDSEENRKGKKKPQKTPTKKGPQKKGQQRRQPARRRPRSFSLSFAWGWRPSPPADNRQLDAQKKNPRRWAGLTRRP